MVKFSSKVAKYAKKPLSDKLLDLFIYLSMLVVLVCTLFVFMYVISCSVSDPEAVIRKDIYFFPKGFSLNAYTHLFRYGDILKYYRNSIFYTVTGCIMSTVFTICGAYVLSSPAFSCRRIIMLFITFTMYFSGGLVPTFLLVSKLGIYNTVWALLLPGLISPFNLIVARTFFHNLPQSLFESARLDGASEFRILLRIAIPLSGAIIAVLGLYYAVAQWNSYFSAMIYLPNKDLQPLQVYLVNILITESSTANKSVASSLTRANSLTSIQLKYCAIVVTILPIICVYPFVQKYFVKGVMIGALKD